MKLSKRLQAVADYVTKDDRLIDVGADHGYLDIYLALNKKNKLLIASDISKKVIETTKSNIEKYHLQDKIKVICTDGLKGVNDNYNTIVLSGLGSFTILNVLKDNKKAKKLIISSNNNWDSIRKEVSKLGYYLVEEKLVYEKNKLYTIMLFKKGYKKLSNKEMNVGIYNTKNKGLYARYYGEINNIYNNVPFTKISKKLCYYKRKKYLQSYLRKENRSI